jgi:hyaluronan synthase
MTAQSNSIRFEHATHTYSKRAIPASRKRYFKILAGVLFFILFEAVIFYKLMQIFSVEHLWWVSLYTSVTTLFLLSRPIVTFFYKDRHTHRFGPERYPTVTFVIAAKNEEDAIYETIKTCIQSDYPSKMECIVVDDGSTDDTLAQMKRAQKDFETKEVRFDVVSFAHNKGKREAMAYGISRANGDILVFVDSDSFVAPGAVKKLVDHFLRDPRIGAISGNTKVENHTTNMLTKMQAARYGISFDVFKVAESVFGTVTCCPGCFSAYRTDVARAIAPAWLERTVFGTKSTFGDDRSLTNFVLKAGWNVTYCRDAIATTIVPDTYKKFFKQQLRWKKSWIREGACGAALFMWRKHPFAAASFYINLIIPIVSPFIVGAGLLSNIIHGNLFMAMLFLASVSLMSLVFGLYEYLLSGNKYWFYAVPFSIFYSVVLEW